MVLDQSHSTMSNGSNNQAGSGSVDILLCTLNGARFLPSQLASFEAQDFTGWRLFVSDDGSEDDTIALLTEFQEKHGPHRVTIRHGPAKGFVRNFLSLICDPALKSEYYALSDQDDIWDAHKLSRARSFLMNAPADVPSVYASRTRLIDDEGIEFGLSPLFGKPPHFRNALVQNVAGGNTMVFNEQTRRLLMKAGPDVDVPAHDWWIYLAIAAVGGRIFYDPLPTVAYRIHASNLIGSTRSLRNRIRHGQMLWKGRFKSWTDSNIRALERVQDLMIEENKQTFELFRRSRNLNLLSRVYGLLRSGIYRQTLLGNIGLCLAVLFRKI
jgi:glycosyltransferase involved in cell wall biosynthesis